MDIIKVIPESAVKDHENVCCPKFNPTDWHEKVFDFSNYHFIKGTTRSLFYIPLNFGKVMSRCLEDIEKAKMTYKNKYLVLSQDVSMFKAEHYFLTKDDVPGYTVEKIKGHYMAHVFDGPYKMMPKWIKSMHEKANASGHDYKQILAFYTTCPKCAKESGHNYVVLFGKT